MKASKIEVIMLFALVFALPLQAAQNSTRKSPTVAIVVSVDDSDQIANVMARLQKDCRSVKLTTNGKEADYELNISVLKKIDNDVLPHRTRVFFNFTVFDSDQNTLRTISRTYLPTAAKEVCAFLNSIVVVEIVDGLKLTGTFAGKEAHTDNATLTVVINGEHALLDCDEHRAGCTTIGPGKYYGELTGKSVWINAKVPLTHQDVRDHYIIAGSW